MGVVREQRLGTASAMVATMRTMGQTLALAITGAVFTSRELFHASQLTQEQALVAGFKDALLVALIISIVAFLVTLVGRIVIAKADGIA